VGFFTDYMLFILMEHEHQP